MYGYTPGNDAGSITHSLPASETLIQTYGYDKTHRRISTALGGTNPTAYQYTPPALGTVAYDPAAPDNAIPKVGPSTLTYDANRNLTFDGSNTLAYDVDNRLVSAVSGSWPAVGGVPQITYQYDPFGSRKQSVVGSTGAGRKHFLVAGGEIAAWHPGAGTDRSTLHIPLHGPGGETVGDLVSLNGAQPGTITYYHTDLQGSVVATTSGGAVAGRYTYGPFGETTAGGPLNRYTGEVLDAETGLIYLRARHYAAVLGRFVQRDPIGYRGGNNLYGYVGNNPLNETDPSGLSGADQNEFNAQRATPTRVSTYYSIGATNTGGGASGFSRGGSPAGYAPGPTITVDPRRAGVADSGGRIPSFGMLNGASGGYATDGGPDPVTAGKQYAQNSAGQFSGPVIDDDRMNHIVARHGATGLCPDQNSGRFFPEYSTLAAIRAMANQLYSMAGPANISPAGNGFFSVTGQMMAINVETGAQRPVDVGRTSMFGPSTNEVTMIMDSGGRVITMYPSK